MLNFCLTWLVLLLQAGMGVHPDQLATRPDQLAGAKSTTPPDVSTVSSGFVITLPKQEEYMIIEFVQKEKGHGFYSYDTRCVIVYPKGKKSKVAFLIDRVDETSEVFYANAPRPSWCFKESGR